MTQSRNYADSHRVVSISAKRFEASPYVDRYATPQTVFGVYSGRFYPLSLGRDPDPLARRSVLVRPRKRRVRRLARGACSGLDVVISDPQSWVMQIQGPASLDVLAAACAVPPDPFPYFAVAEVEMGGQDILVSRTGWSGELGFEIYTRAETDALALWEHVVETGAELRSEDGAAFTVVELPFHDREKATTRGLPQRPSGTV